MTVRVAALEMRLDELGEYARQIGELSILLQQNRRDFRQNLADRKYFEREYTKEKSEFLLRGIERKHRQLVYTRRCLQARLELLLGDNEEKRQELLEFQG